MSKKNIIFTNEITNEMYEDKKRELLEEYGESETTEGGIWQCLNEDVAIWFDSEKMLLNQDLDNNIIAIADLGLWNGRKKGYKILGKNLNEVIGYFGCDNVDIYCDKHNVVAECNHHDGTNNLLFREIKENINRELLLDKIYNETITSKDITRYTKSLKPYVKEIYGF